MKSGKIILGTLAGVTAGTVLGMLFAPEKGAVTRRNISRRSSDYADALKGKVDAYADAMNTRVDTFKDKAIGWLERRKATLTQPDAGPNTEVTI